MENCYILDKYGAPKINILEEFDIRYLALQCVIDGKLQAEYMYYPYIVASNPKKYLKKIEIAKAAEKSGIKFIKLANDTDEYPIVFYKNDKNKSVAILASYILSKYEKELKQSISAYDYILHYLYGYDEEYNRRYFLSKYIYHELGKIMLKEVEEINNNKTMTPKEKYMAKYDLTIGRKNFDKFYDNIKKKAMEILDKIKKSKDLENYSKNIEIHDFKFTLQNSIKNNPMYRNL